MNRPARRCPSRAQPRDPVRVAEPSTAADHDLDYERLLFFSDAVFAIAITLLIIEVRLPALPEHATDADAAAALERIAPAIFAYVLSFATIGLYWLGHWRRYRYIERIDERLVGLNLVQLALVAFIPFPTAMMGDHGDLALVVAIYALSLSAAWVLGPLTWLYAWRAGLVRAGVAPGYVRLAAMRGVAVPLVMLASLPFMPLIGPSRIGLTWILIVPVQIVLSRLIRENEAGQPIG